ncbi:hypothetical protein BS50DRAFT_546564 [Corynespora cassiicola Philippines]|uniref:Rhodopsin domain-containing protein n=1 Tax=Corynespora cassiicola Philippines TaxID=1448308 RepID=A0A2T2P0X5_CORCC|nr:hypothetical protein BS50DRAFT_546564 [Corynespora cassiicola Philippines]
MADLSPAGYRFATITPEDHRGVIYIATFLAFTYYNLTFLTRCFIKWHMFGLDDWAVVVAQIISIIQFVLLLVSLSAGLGTSFDTLSEHDYNRMAAYGNQIALYISLGLSKCATILLVQRLFTRDIKKFWMICNAISVLMALWTIVAALLVSVGCSPQSTAPTMESQICPGIYDRYHGLVVTDALTDILLVMAPTCLVWQLQMHISLKVQVVFVFAFRLPLVPLSILTLRNWNHSLHSSNPGIDRTPVILYQQGQLCFSLISATVPCLKSFIRSFDTGSGVKVGYSSHAYGSSGDRHGESHRMQSLDSSGSAIRNRHSDRGANKTNPRPFTGASLGRGKVGDSVAKSTTLAYSSQNEVDEDVLSHGSQELIIRRDVKWEVYSENAP